MTREDLICEILLYKFYIFHPDALALLTQQRLESLS